MKLPITFTVKNDDVTPNQDEWTAKLGEETLSIGTPKEFGGKGLGASPEHLFASSLLECFIGTFRVVAKRSNFKYNSIQGEATVTVDNDEEGNPWMKEVQIHVKINTDASKKKQDSIVHVTLDNCFIHKSVKSNVVVTHE